MAPGAPGNTNTVAVPTHQTMRESYDSFLKLLHECPAVYRYGQYSWLMILRKKATARSSTKTAGQTFAACNEMFNKGRLGEIVPWIESNCSTSIDDELATLLSNKCFHFANMVGNYVTRLGGLRGVQTRGTQLAAGAIFIPSSIPSSPKKNPPYYTRVAYNLQQLARYVGKIKESLDSGYLVRAGVLSGCDWDYPLPNRTAGDITEQFVPEHYLLILGYDGDEFLFWDPHYIATGRAPFSRPFGILTYQATKGRLSTARNDGELSVNESGDFKVDPPNLPNQGTNHRYQVVSLLEIRLSTHN